VSVFWGEQHGWAFCCLGLVCFLKNLLIEDLAEGQVF
jgi:hypothetical protein